MKNQRGLNIQAVSKQIAYEKHLKELAERKAMKDSLKPEAKTKVLMIKVTPTMDDQIREKAVCLGLNVSDYIRNLIEEDLKNEL
ncbi:MAG: hypothetical protein II306_07055 [Clostridia bacterium]|nr:hypothetical protein [Clostridia bacterium]